MKICGAPTIFQPCPQTATANGSCFYHSKVQAGLLQPVREYLGELEIETLMGGRVHGDGRRLDAYVID